MPARFADRPRPRGAWGSTTSYLRGDLVSFDGRTWIALVPSTNVEPFAGASWAVFADRGEQGEQGQQGVQGEQGEPGVQGVQGIQGATGASGVVSVTAPITNNGTSTEAIIGVTTGTANGIAPLDANGKVPSANLPAIAITDTHVVSSQSAMLALTAEVGDVAVRTDLSKSFILATSPATTLANWQEILAPPDAVSSVDGKTGAVSLATDYAPLSHTHSQSNITNLTSDLAAKAPLDNPTFTGTVTAPTLSVTGNATVSGSLEGHKVITVANSTGSTITKGSAVYINGAAGDNARIALAQANAESTSSKTLGLAYEDIPNGSTTGKVLTEGYLDGIDTSTAGAAGDPIWLSPTTAGGLLYGLSNKPSAPNHLVFLGVVARKQQNNGRVFVKVQNGFELDELHTVDLNTSTPTNGQVLTFDSSTGLWKNQTITESQVTNLTSDLAGKAASVHTHAASDVTSGTLDIARVPTGTTSTTVALGNHTHTGLSVQAAGTASVRALGTGATDATAGNDSRLSDARTPTTHGSTHGVLGADPVYINAGLQVTSGFLPYSRDPNWPTQSTICLSTMPRWAMVNGYQISAAGTVYAQLAYATGTTVSNIRFYMSTAGASTTDFRVGIWDSSRNLVAQTASLASSISGTAGVITAALSATLTLAGTYYIGYACYGGTLPFLRGTQPGASGTAAAPVMAYTQTGWTGGTLPSVTSASGATNWFWIEAY